MIIVWNGVAQECSVCCKAEDYIINSKLLIVINSY